MDQCCLLSQETIIFWFWHLKWCPRCVHDFTFLLTFCAFNSCLTGNTGRRRARRDFVFRHSLYRCFVTINLLFSSLRELRFPESIKQLLLFFWRRSHCFYRERVAMINHARLHTFAQAPTLHRLPSPNPMRRDIKWDLFYLMLCTRCNDTAFYIFDAYPCTSEPQSDKIYHCRLSMLPCRNKTIKH